jgi:hypothetical protein
MKVKANITLAVLYSIAIICFGFWWADNFPAHVHLKGDESFFEIEFVGIVTILAFLCLKTINKKLSWKFILLAPVSTAFFSIVVTLISASLSSSGGTTVETLRQYGVIHSIVTIIMAYAKIRSVSSHMNAGKQKPL